MPALSGPQYKRALAHYRLTQGQASWLFNGKTRSSGRRWAAEGAPFHVALLLRVMHRYGLTPKDIERCGARYRKKDDE